MRGRPKRSATIDPLAQPGHPVRSAVRDWRSIWDARTIVAGSLATVAVASVSVGLLGRYLNSIDRGSFSETEAVAHVAAVALLFLTSTVVVGSLVGAFRQGNRWTLVRTVITAYFGLMLVFASIFYIESFFGDLRDAIYKYDGYRADALHQIAGPEYLSRRAFSGIESRFWSGVDWPVHSGKFPNGLPPGAYKISVEQMRSIAGSRAMNDVVQFLPEASFAVFGDCLHLSVTTMTTVGYGDILPRSTGARIATDIEAVCNSLLLIFGLGMIFGNLRPGIAVEPKPPSAAAPPECEAVAAGGITSSSC